MNQHPAGGKQRDGESEPGKKENKKRDGGGSDCSRKHQRNNAQQLNETEMGSTDSAASNTHGGGSSCGLVSSLFPNSCRGRAESFARRLHRRLTSLGGEGNSTDDAGRALVNRSTETSWLHAPTGQRTTTSAPSNSATSLSSSLQAVERVLESQPHHSHENDVYYDFDNDHAEHESEGTISPAEMANDVELAKILVNPGILKSNHHEACHCSPGPRPPDHNQAPESGYVFSSPIAGFSPDTDNSEVYFDPESSETERNSHAEMFYDPADTTESDTSNIPNGATKICKLSGRRRFERDGQDSEMCKKQLDDNSESSSSSCNPGTLENVMTTGVPVGCSSEESINGRSSLETTSPSHESLWSTFDDSTMSLQDESPSVTGQKSAVLSIRLAKSHSDSEIPAHISVNTENYDEVDFHKNCLTESERGCMINGEKNAVDLPAIDRLRIDDNVELANDGLSVNTEEKSEECPLASSVLSTLDESVKIQVNLRTSDSYGNEDISKLVDRLARSPNVDGIIKDEEEQVDNDDNENEDEEETEENERPQRVRRCSSLKTGKTPPGTPGRKKIVRFADVLGLDLADVRTFLDEIPKVPNSAYSDLIYDEAFQKDSSPVNFWGTGPATFTTPLFAATMGPKGPMAGVKLDRILVPLFQQPGGLPNFLDLVRERQVCLENVVVQDPVTMCLQGTVRVRNLDFHKSVHVRYSLDSWRNFSDLQATYAANSCDGFSDKFTFALYCHTLKVGQRLELAVRFQCKGTQYWDNNAGINYCFQCLPATPANPGTYIPITAPVTSHSSTHEWSPTFY